MEYQNIDENARQQACENVKKIAEAIIRIRKKYYLCFSKISDADQRRYNQLKAHMRSIASENGLEKLNAELISNIDTQYGEDIPDVDENGNPSNGSIEDLHQKFINAVAMQAELTKLAKKSIDTDPKLANKYFKKAHECQEIAKKFEEVLRKIYSENRLSYDRVAVFEDKFGEQAKEYMINILEADYDKYTSQDCLIVEDITKAMNECMRKEDKAPKLETERV